MNTYSIQINGDDYTSYAVFPFKFAELLDEQLDEANVTLKQIGVEYFRPMTEVTVTLTNAPTCLLNQAMVEDLPYEKPVTRVFSQGRLTETLELHFLIAKDTAIECPVGSGKYNHEIYLIERTKFLERFLIDNLSFRNTLGKFGEFELGNCEGYYTETDYTSMEDLVADRHGTVIANDRFVSSFLEMSQLITRNFQTYGDVYFAPTGARVFEDEKNINRFGEDAYVITGADREYFNFLSSTTETFNSAGLQVPYLTYDEDEYVYTAPSGVFTIKQSIKQYVEITPLNPFNTYRKFDIIYTQSWVTNRYPLKKWTVREVIQRLFDTVEPIHYGEELRFVLDEIDLDMLAPEFNFTSMTLREALQQVGGFIHAEPRIIGKQGNQFVVGFDFYGDMTKSRISEQKYITATFGTDINEYCTALDSTAENLVNKLNWAQGVSIEPYKNGYISLRSETTTARMTEDNNSFIPTSLPVEEVHSLICNYNNTDYDLTPFVFEITNYNNLSSYEGTFPYAKAYALSFATGEKNIKGLFFKAEHAISPVFQNYSIKNILKSLGANVSSLTGQEYFKLKFRISYLTISTQRVKTHKRVILDGLPSTIAYNQSANKIETSFYGEHLKGVVERLGNVEKTYTYKLAFLSTLPKVGTLFDNDYYISAVTTEFLPQYIKCTVALSKDFNRLSQYIGVSSNKRMWEISERQVTERNSIYTDFIKIEPMSENPPASSQGIARDLLNGWTLSENNILHAVCTFKSKDRTQEYNTITLPVVKSAMGNSAVITFKYEDNYSAGQRSQYVQGDGTQGDTATGYWGAYVPYTDYYGRGYYLDINFTAAVDAHEDDEFNLPLADKTGYAPRKIENWLYRKDTAETPCITYELACVTTSKDILIGEVMKNSKLINANGIDDSELLLVTFNKRLNAVRPVIKDYTVSSASWSFSNQTDSIIFTGDRTCTAWAIITPVQTETINVTDEDGRDTTQTITSGGELLIGGNGNMPERLDFTLIHKIGE